MDTPGLFDTDKAQAEIKFELSKVIDECSSGIDAFMYVHNGSVRFSPEEQNTVKELEVSYRIIKGNITHHIQICVMRTYICILYR